jgi:putative heme-binding domain-containing protein
LKSKLLVKIIEDNKTNDTSINKLVLHALDIKTVRQSPIAQKALKEVIASVKGTPEYIEFIRRYEVRSENPNLLQLAIDEKDENIGRDAAGLLLELGGSHLAWKVINGKDTTQTKAFLTALSKVGSKQSIDMIQTVALSKKYSVDIRKDAASKIGRSRDGEERVIEILKNKKVPQELIPDVVASVSGSWRGSIKTEAQSYLPNKVAVASKKAPTLAEMENIKGDAATGKAVFTNICAVCHMVNKEGNDFGPALTEIGSKYPREGLLDAIVHPSDGISFGYEGWELKMKDGSTLSGIIASKTETDIDLKLPGGAKQHIKTSDVQSMKEMKESLMPEGLYQNRSTQDMANLLEYLETLKKK